MKDNPDIDLIWTGLFGPKWMRILSFIPAQAGLLKLKNINSLKDIYLQVGELSFSSIYFLRDEKGMELIDGIRKDNYRVNVDSILWMRQIILYWKLTLTIWAVSATEKVSSD